MTVRCGCRSPHRTWCASSSSMVVDYMRYGVAMAMLVVGTVRDSCHVIEWTWCGNGCHWWSTSGMVVSMGASMVVLCGFIECGVIILVVGRSCVRRLSDYSILATSLRVEGSWIIMGKIHHTCTIIHNYHKPLATCVPTWKLNLLGPGLSTRVPFIAVSSIN